jgi:ornithine cyclodeaminase
MPVRILDQEQVTSLLGMRECIGVMEDAFRALGSGGAVQPLRSVLLVPGGVGAFGVMPAYLAPPGALGVKAITVFPGNEGTEYDSHQGVVLVFEPVNGTLTGILDASSITAIRTAAVSGLATRLLARPDAGHLAILGSGVQADTHLDAMLVARPIQQVSVWSRTPEHAGRFAARARARYAGLRVEPHPDVESAVGRADIICTVTSAREPVLRGAWLAPGAHVNAVGASQPGARELDSDAVTNASLYVDRRESALTESDDVLAPLREARFGPDHIRGELGDLLTGRAEGRQARGEITVFKSLGLAIEDLAAAHYVVGEAQRRGIGLVVDLGGVREEF